MPELKIGLCQECFQSNHHKTFVVSWETKINEHLWCVKSKWRYLESILVLQITLRRDYSTQISVLYEVLYRPVLSKFITQVKYSWKQCQPTWFKDSNAEWLKCVCKAWHSVLELRAWVMELDLALCITWMMSLSFWPKSCLYCRPSKKEITRDPSVKSQKVNNDFLLRTMPSDPLTFETQLVESYLIIDTSIQREICYSIMLSGSTNLLNHKAMYCKIILRYCTSPMYA